MHKRIILPAVIILLMSIFITTLWLLHSKFDRAPDLIFTIIDGSQIELKTLHGQPVLVTFWATTCKICVKKMPQLQTLYKELAPKGLEIIGIAMAYDPPNRVLEMTEQKQISYPVALDIDGTLARAFGNVSYTPTTFLIAPDGTIVKHKTGELNINRIRQDVIIMLSDQAQKLNPQSS